MKSSLASFVFAVILPFSGFAQTLANYQAEVTSQGPAHYFKLDGSLASAMNEAVVLESFGGGGYAGDVFRNPTNSYFFVDQTSFLRNLSDSLINGGGTSNTSSTATGSITFLFRTLSDVNTGQRFLFSAGNNAANGNAFALFLENTNVANGDPNSLKLRFGNNTTTIRSAADLAPNTWYYFALTYNESSLSSNKATWYVGRSGGVLSSGVTTNSPEAVAGEGAGLAIGNKLELDAGFRNPGSGRIDEFAIWNRQLSPTEISNQFTKLPQPAPPGATYQQVVDSQIPKYYFKLDGSLLESVGGGLALSINGPSGAFASDLFGNPDGAYSFTVTNDALFITDDLINGGGPGTDDTAKGTGTISFLFRMLSDTNNEGQRFLFSAPASTTAGNQLALFLESANPTTGGNPNSLKLRVGNTTKGNIGSTDPVPVAQPENLVPNAWYYFAMTYDESRNTPEVFVYFGQVGQTLANTSFNPANNSVVGDNGTLWIGNRDTLTSGFRNPGVGAIDEFAIWHDELTAAEIAAQFNATTPVIAGPAPTLSIVLSEGNVVLLWPSNTAAGYVLEATNVLDSTTIGVTSWPSAGVATVVGTNYVVTNTVSAGNNFYRLHKQ